MKRILLIAVVLFVALSLTLPMGTVMADGPGPYWIAAHAVVVNGDQEETAWADCQNSQPFPGNNWAWYFIYPFENNQWGLFAGKNTYIGLVSVNITGNNLAITFETEYGWLMTETHVAVAESLAGIPQTKSGNPKVGQFAILNSPTKSGMEHEPPVDTWTYNYTLP